MKDSAVFTILAMATPIFLVIIMLGTLANNGLIGAPSVNSTKNTEIAQPQNNTNNNKNDKQDF